MFKALITPSLAASLALVAALPAVAQESTITYVCTFDQVIPGLGFVPVTFSPEIYAVLGGDPDDCQTPVPGFETPE